MNAHIRLSRAHSTSLGEHEEQERAPLTRRRMGNRKRGVSAI